MTDSSQQTAPAATLDHVTSANDNTKAGGVTAAHPVPQLILPLPGEPAPFPLDGLGPILGKSAKAIAEIVQAPTAMAGTSVLAAATLAVQAHGDVQFPHGMVRPVSEFFVPIAQSGDRKTALDGWAMLAVREFMREQLAQYDAMMEAHEAEQGEGPMAEQEPRKPPVLPTILMDDPSPEGMFRALSEGWPSAGIFTDEAGRFLGGYAMAPEQRLRTATTLSKLWDGGELTRVRSSDRPAVLVDRRLSCHLMMQPEIANGLLSDRMMRDQGLLSRMLVTAPASLMGTRFFRRPQQEDVGIAHQLRDHLLAILREPLPIAMRPRGALKCRPVPFAPEAEKSWIKFHDTIEQQLAKDGRLRPIAGLTAKLAEHAGRIAGVLALVEDLQAGEIKERHMEGAVGLAEHYAAEALRLSMATGAFNPDLALAAKLGGWIRRFEGRDVSLVQIEQNATPTVLRNAAKARRMMAILEERGWVVRKPGRHVVNGQPRNEVWFVVPHDEQGIIKATAQSCG